MKSPAILLLSIMLSAGAACGQSDTSGADSATCDTVVSTTPSIADFPVDSIPPAALEDRYTRLTDEDFRIVAEELGVEVAAIKAVVSIEAGHSMHGFYAPGVPVVNFDPTMYRKFAGKVSATKPDKNEKVPAGLSGYALKEWTQLVNARKKNPDGANMGTFWGMFQIGGFNYKLCGCESINQFVELMSDSEFAQLELFAKFIYNTGMATSLKNKNWAAFARKYNGAGYAKRGYHTKMANAYKKFKAQESKK